MPPPTTPQHQEAQEGQRIRHPEVEVRLIGRDGNAYTVIGAVSEALRRAGHGAEVGEFMSEAGSGDYNTLLRACMRWVTVR